MMNLIKKNWGAGLVIALIIACTAVLKSKWGANPAVHDSLEYVLMALGAIGTAAVKSLFGAQAAAVEQALELPKDKS